jgi:hypothetical protein
VNNVILIDTETEAKPIIYLALPAFFLLSLPSPFGVDSKRLLTYGLLCIRREGEVHKQGSFKEAKEFTSNQTRTDKIYLEGRGYTYLTILVFLQIIIFLFLLKF